jgi:hypothetical protein
VQVDVVRVDLEVANAMRAIQGTLRVAFARAALVEDVDKLFTSEFGVVYDRLQARAEQDDYLLTQGTGATDALVEASLRTIFTGEVVDQDLQGEWDSRRGALEKGPDGKPQALVAIQAARRLVVSHIRAACAGVRQWQARAIASAKASGQGRGGERAQRAARPWEPRDRDRRAPADEFQGQSVCQNWVSWLRTGEHGIFRCRRSNCSFAPCNGRSIRESAKDFFRGHRGGPR